MVVCYRRFDKEFSGVFLNSSSNNTGQDTANRASTYIATPEVVADPNWLADSGATNHVTADLGSLNIKADYHC